MCTPAKCQSFNLSRLGNTYGYAYFTKVKHILEFFGRNLTRSNEFLQA